MTPDLQTDPEITVGVEPLAPRVVGVDTVSESAICVTFETGEQREVDVSPLLGRGVFCALADLESFAAVSVVEGGGGIEWASGADLSANRLYFGPR